MGIKLLRFRLSELGTFRFFCKRCNRGVIEVQSNRLDAAVEKNGRCRFCDQDTLTDAQRQALTDLQHALTVLTDDDQHFGIEFDLADNSPEAK